MTARAIALFLSSGLATLSLARPTLADSSTANAQQAFETRAGWFAGAAMSAGASTARGGGFEMAARFSARAGWGWRWLTAEMQPAYAAIVADGRGSTFLVDAVLNLYPQHWWFFRVGAGPAFFIPDAGDVEPGLTATGGLGAELFSDRYWATALTVTYEPELYRDQDITHQVFATVGITRY